MTAAQEGRGPAQEGEDVMEERIVELELKFTEQQRLLQELSDVVYVQGQSLERLEHELAAMGQKLAAIEPGWWTRTSSSLRRTSRRGHPSWVFTCILAFRVWCTGQRSAISSSFARCSSVSAPSRVMIRSTTSILAGWVTQSTQSWACTFRWRRLMRARSSGHFRLSA